MTIALNGILILIVLVIAYWWANQGLFSAILHMMCVIGAGAVALAVYEPITVGLLLRGIWFDDYAWGVSLVGVFVITLLIFRVASDKIVRANVNVPTWANFAFGLPVGAISGILALGIFMIGAGMVQSYRSVMEYEGYGRSSQTGRVEYLGPALWIPVHMWTNEFYNYLSVGALYPTFNDSPLVQENPELYKQASLLRDSAAEGKGKLSLAPDAVTIRAVKRDPESNRHVVAVEFGATARDWGQQLTLSNSQVRLITNGSNDPRQRPGVVHPDAWSQRTAENRDGLTRFVFDSRENYVTSIPGSERTSVAFEFSVPRNHTARYIQIRGTRFRLPRAMDAEAGEIAITFEQVTAQLGSGPNIQEHVEVKSSTAPIRASLNQPRGSLKLVDNQFNEGQHTFPSRGERPPRGLSVEAIYEPPGTRVVQVYMRWNDPHNMFRQSVRQAVSQSARLMLVDESGNTYSPIGYMHEGRQGITIRLDPSRYLPTINDFPNLPQDGPDTLRIIFRVTQDVTIKGLMLGDVTLGLCDVPIERK